MSACGVISDSQPTNVVADKGSQFGEDEKSRNWVCEKRVQKSLDDIPFCMYLNLTLCLMTTLLS